MIERQAHDLYHELEQEVGERGLTMESYLGVLQKTQEEVEKELHPRAEQVIKRRLVLEAVTAAEGLEVSDDEIRERIRTDAELLGRDPNQLVLDIYKSGRHEQSAKNSLSPKRSTSSPRAPCPSRFEDDADEAGAAEGDEVPAANDTAVEAPVEKSEKAGEGRRRTRRRPASPSPRPNEPTARQRQRPARQAP